jgi:hypothetical protein
MDLLSAKLKDFNGRSSHDYVVLVFRSDKNWERVGANNFEIPAKGTWESGMAQITNLFLMAKLMRSAF